MVHNSVLQIIVVFFIKKNLSYFSIFTFLLLCTTSCGRLMVGSNPENTPTANYESFYTQVKENYSFFEEKAINWDSMDIAYRPLVHDSLSNDSLYLILSKMLYALQDGHVNLFIRNDRSSNADWYLDYPANFNQEFVHRTYWGKDYQISEALLHTWMDSIGYVYYGAFSASFNKKNLDYVLNRFAKAKGLIIDVRSNGGGSMGNVYRLVERFVPEKAFMGSIQRKAGKGAADFSEPDSLFVAPLVDYAKRAKARAEAKAKAEAKKRRKGQSLEEEKEKEETAEASAKPPKRLGAGQWSVADSTGMFLQKPIVVLTNRKSYSATNFFAAFMSTLSNVTILGDKSGGGGGVPVSFELPNGWAFRISATRTYLPDGTTIENGIEPDIYQSTGPEEEIQGIDAIIERAKKVINELAAN